MGKHLSRCAECLAMIFAWISPVNAVGKSDSPPCKSWNAVRNVLSRRFSLRYIVIISRQRVPPLVSLSSSDIGHRQLNASSKIFESIIPLSLYPSLLYRSFIRKLRIERERIEIFFNNKKVVKQGSMSLVKIITFDDSCRFVLFSLFRICFSNFFFFFIFFHLILARPLYFFKGFIASIN